MATGYTRQSTAGIVDGQTITAALFNNEFNAIVTAFNETNGHSHDGTTNGGAGINALVADAITLGTGDNTDVVLTFFAASNSGLLSWMEDEDYFKFSDDILIDTTEKLQFRDTDIYLNSSADGQLDLVADTTFAVTAPATTVSGTLNVTGASTLTGNVAVTGTLSIGGTEITACSSSPTDGATTTPISSDWAFDNVKTAVPNDAVFTDTVTAATRVQGGTSGTLVSGDITIAASGAASVSQSTNTITIGATDTTYATATSSTAGLVKIGFTENGKNYPVELVNDQAYVNVPWTDTDTTYATATSSTAGLVKIGYTESGKNYPVELSNGKAYVNVPWTDTNTTYTGDGNYGITISGTSIRLEDDRRRNSSTTSVYTGNTHDYIHFDPNNGMRFYTAASEDMRLTNTGNLHVDGNITAYSSTVSDKRLKSNITNISKALDKVGKINGVTFVRNHNGEKAAGIVAQEVMEVLPEAVKSQTLPLHTGEEDKEYYVVEYDALTGLLVEAIKELKAEVDELKGGK